MTPLALISSFLKLLDFFIKEKLNLFGDYEDAVDQKNNILFHSALSPYLNLGLITPDIIMQKVMNFHHSKGVRLNSLEGFIRQIIGWREFMRGIYQNYYKEMENGNFFKHSRKMKLSFTSLKKLQKIRLLLFLVPTKKLNQIKYQTKN